MKASLYLAFYLFVLVIINAQANEHSFNVTSHTCFFARPQFDVGTPEFLSFNKYQRWQNDQTDGGSSLQIVPFGGSSVKSAKLGGFFMPFGSNEAIVDGNINFTENALLPQHFNIFSVHYTPAAASATGITNLSQAFFGVIKTNPRQTVTGLGFVYDQQFYWHNDLFYFFSISSPLIRLKNNMHLEEVIANDGENIFYDVPPIVTEKTNLDSPMFSMSKALQQDNWLYGKIDNKSRKKTALAFIQTKCGASLRYRDDFILEPFIGFTIPTGNQPNAEYIFNPVIGNGGHFGLLWGTGFELFLWQNQPESMDLTFNADLVMQYLFRTKQYRSIDLKNKPWSRYIEIYKDYNQANMAFNTIDVLSKAFLSSPGINLLTQELYVKPGFNCALNISLAFNQTNECRGFNGEIGWNLYAKQTERVWLVHKFETQAAIKDYVGSGLTNAARNMSENQLLNEASRLNLGAAGFPADVLSVYDYSVIREKDLNLSSATHPSFLTHTIYGIIGYHYDEFPMPVLTGLGISYEFSRTNNALDRWLMWSKLGVSF